MFWLHFWAAVMSSIIPYCQLFRKTGENQLMWKVTVWLSGENDCKIVVNVFFNTCSGRSRAVHIQSSLSERARWYSGSRLYDFACFSFSCWVRLLQDNSATISFRHRKYIREHSEARICHETRLEVLLNGRRVKMNTETPGGLLE